jgi:hypothetical protein
VNVLDLFSGIGGFSLGLERAGMRTVAFCESEPYPASVLAARWPSLPVYPDVRELTADRLAADRIAPPKSSAEASPAKTSVSLAVALALLEHDQGCGVSSRVSLASFDPVTSSWRTSQHCLSGELETFLETWPESGMTRSGRLYPRAPWVRHICDDECSLWPTPTASMDGRGFGIPLHERSGRYKRSTVSRIRALIGEHGWRIHPRFTEALMGFPTEWSAIAQSETRSSRRSQKSSGGQS